MSPFGPVAVAFVAMRCRDLVEAERFYEMLGLRFDEEQHGPGPRHLAARVGAIVIELYPASTGHVDGGDPATIGLEVADLGEVERALTAAGVPVRRVTADDDSGPTLVVTDPDGRQVRVAKAD